MRDASVQLVTWVNLMVHGSESLTDEACYYRTVTRIRRKVTTMFHVKNGKETIVAWKSDLNRILHVLNVSSTVSVRPQLTVFSQTELSVNTRVVVSIIHHDVVAILNTSLHS